MSNPRRIAWLIPLIFVVCAVVDFIMGYIHGRTMSAGVIRAVLGLFGTTFYLFIFRPWKGNDE
jgi:uncharacterized membrane protein